MDEATARKRLENGSMWEAFCDRLKAAGKLLDQEGVPGDLQTRADGYRYLTRMLRAGLESAVDYADPQYPAFFRLADETKKILNDNPDAYYLNCVIDGRFDYRITGTRGTTRWLSFGTKGGAGDPGGMKSTGEIDATDMEIRPDGTFELLVSATPKPGNWLPMKEDSRIMVVRQTYGIKEEERVAELKIECLNPERPNNNLVPTELEGQLERALGFLEATVQLGVDWMNLYHETTLNGLPKHDQKVLHAAGGDPNICYYQSYWKLAPDEALLVTLDDIPECQIWSLQISNYWMESLDHRFFQIGVNKFTAKYEPDGSARIVVAHEDPGPAFPNWLNTLGNGEGGMLGRFVQSPNPPEQMKTEVVRLADLRARA